MTEQTRLIRYLLYGLLRAILKMNRIKNTASNFQHPRVRGYLRLCSLNRNKPGDGLDQRNSFFDIENFYILASDQLKTNN